MVMDLARNLASGAITPACSSLPSHVPTVVGLRGFINVHAPPQKRVEIHAVNVTIYLKTVIFTGSL